MIHLAIGSGDEGEGSRMLDVCAARLCSLCRLILSAGRQLHRSLLLCFLSLLRAVFYSLSLSPRLFVFVFSARFVYFHICCLTFLKLTSVLSFRIV